MQDDALSRERELFVALEAMTAERDALLAQLRAERSRARTGEAATAQLRTQLRQIRERATRAQRQLAGALGGDPAANDGALFADPEGQLRFEVDLAWARRTTPDEKPHLPLAPWSTGEGFFSSWEQVQGVDRGKVVDVIVDVLTGRASWMEGRQAHPLRAGVAGNAKPLTRNDGAVCWRVSLQTNSPSARRLHYWVLEGGSIELASVRLHDDMRP